jgi:hypothetical protein
MNLFRPRVTDACKVQRERAHPASNSHCFGGLSICGVLLLFLTTLSFAQPKGELRQPAPLDPVRAAREGQALVAELLSKKPEDATNNGVLRIRSAGGELRELSVKIETFCTPSNWVTIYQTMPAANTGAGTRLTVIHTEGQPNEYLLSEASGPNASNTPKKLSAEQTMIPFAGSDFWVADLGLEFLHWPKQLLLRKELRHSQSCSVLESTNPNPVPDGYARVVAWIDLNNDGVLHADAYDAQNRRLKQFDPTELQKVRGERQLEEMEMHNLKTRSHTWIKFNLKSD